MDVSQTKTNASTRVFNIAELMDLILLSLPCDTIHSEITSMRTIHTSQTVSPMWHTLLRESTALRQKLYMSTCLDCTESAIWRETATFPPAQPNPYIPHLLLHQRSWGSAWPFELRDIVALYNDIEPSKPRLWTFSLELSRAQYLRIASPGAWRDLLATSPPFTDFWYTRAFYELGSGRAPFVTHIDYDGNVPKTEQKYCVHRPEGVTLGDIVDAMRELFEKHPTAKFVMVESLRVPSQGEATVAEEGPTTKTYYPGSSAEKTHGWQRGQ
ncbi:hypothetical protein LTR37_012705 [Vermiconidia calcicola]|uniref:Uncharacterized protein n=1 Tax=Vermiconidia calcicola TaxID=1690605 RepID=A0ACC3MYM0_9PEZI|nr:hypothetical protein LTR37_012705 [Vermiconidia calcicola]